MVVGQIESGLGAYGPYAFGVVAVLALVSAGVVVFQKVVKPMMDANLEGAKALSSSIIAAKSIAESAERCIKSSEIQSRVMAHLLERADLLETTEKQ